MDRRQDEWVYAGVNNKCKWDERIIEPVYVWMEIPADVESLVAGVWRPCYITSGIIVFPTVEQAEQAMDDTCKEGPTGAVTALVCVDEAWVEPKDESGYMNVYGAVVSLSSNLNRFGWTEPKKVHGGRNLWEAVRLALNPILGPAAAERKAAAGGHKEG